MRCPWIEPAIRWAVESINIVDGSKDARTEDRTGIFVSGMVSDWQCIGFYFGAGVSQACILRIGEDIDVIHRLVGEPQADGDGKRREGDWGEFRIFVDSGEN